MGLEPTKVLYLQGRNRKIFRSIFGSNENCRICFRDYLTFRNNNNNATLKNNNKMETTKTDAGDSVSQNTACKKSTIAVFVLDFPYKKYTHAYLLHTKNSWKSYTQFEINRNDNNNNLNNNNNMETATTDAADSVSQITNCPVKSWLKQFYRKISIWQEHKCSGNHRRNIPWIPCC